MKFVSIRVVTGDVTALKVFYAALTGVEPTDLAPGFAEIRLDGCTLAISSEDIINKLNGGAIVPRSNRSAMIELEVDDVEAVRARVADGALAEIVQPPTAMPWGNDSMLLRDPDGAIVNIFSRPRR
ncbi:VOC family protein [Devosia oryziradicis]|uniref:VOC family protein n=1 Tax=Devosia oryziradicis TaxID=2801335 RepID=A0ABX7BXI8_9HYPH|nr:VOC family protein [Devosia oryziradicis]QQR36676.1 VOC family protein [Devosia oryziradicis]